MTKKPLEAIAEHFSKVSDPRVDRTKEHKGLGPERMPKTGWKPFKVMDRWGGFDQTTRFRMTAEIPKEFAGQRVVALIRHSGGHFEWGVPMLSAAGEALAYINGQPYQGLDKFHEEIVLSKKAKAGEKFEIALEGVPSTKMDIEHHFEYADMAVLHQEAWDVYWDVLVPFKAYKALDPGYAPVRQLFDVIAKVVRMVDVQHVGTPAYYASCAKTSAWLKKSSSASRTATAWASLFSWATPTSTWG